jgi:TIR domain-containing protein
MLMKRPIEVFFSYAHEDEPLMDEVRRQLVVFDRQGLIKKWHDRLIPPGADWRGRIDERLAHSDVVLLFISPSFFDSDYCYEAEMTEAMRLHRIKSAAVVPIILRPCAWEIAPFARLQALPTDGRPITTWPNRDAACLDVAEGVMRVVNELRGEPIADRRRDPVITEDARILDVRVHRAFFSGDNQECHFVNLTNLSPRRVLEVTHVWYEDEAHHIPIIQRSRTLPVRLELDQSWETWIESSRLPLSHRQDAVSRFRVRISTGSVYASRPNPSVPPMGMVPGGPIF